jgi:hypothetical protein
MGCLDFSDERDKYHLAIIRRRLGRRSLKPHLDTVWEIHGPHEGMNFQVYMGWAGPIKGTGDVCVAIYPWATYEIQDTNQWNMVGAENRIYIDT